MSKGKGYKQNRCEHLEVQKLRDSLWDCLSSKASLETNRWPKSNQCLQSILEGVLFLLLYVSVCWAMSTQICVTITNCPKDTFFFLSYYFGTLIILFTYCAPCSVFTTALKTRSILNGITMLVSSLSEAMCACFTHNQKGQQCGSAQGKTKNMSN